MTTVRHSIKTDRAGTLIAAGVAIASVSIAMGALPALLVVAVPVAIAAAVYALRRPTVMLVVVIVGEVANLVGVVADGRLPLFGLSLLLGLISIGIALRDPVARARLNHWTWCALGLTAAYLATQFLAAFGSQDPAATVTALRDVVLDCAFLVMLVLLAQISGRTWVMAAAVVVPLALISVLCLISQVGFDGAQSFGGLATVTEGSGEMITTLRFGGPGLDTNFWGRNLLLGLPLAAALTVRAVQFRRRWASLGWAAALAALLAGVYLTQSRGTMISTAVVFAVWVMASGPVARRRGILALPVLSLALFVPGIGDRMTALFSDVSGQGALHSVDPSVLGRVAAQEMAWAMFTDKPMMGLGPGVYESAVSDYAGRVPTAVLHPVGAAHNLYAQIAAESGVVGLLGWSAFFGGFVVLSIVQVVRLSGAGSGSERCLAAGVTAALIGWAVASIFLHLACFRTLAIILALAVALVSTTRSAPVVATEVGQGGIREVLVGALLGVAVAGVVLTVSETEAPTASQTLTLVPAEQVSEQFGYALDVRRREVVLPTYAAMMVANSAATEAIPDPVRGVITLSTAGVDRYSARSGLGIAVANAHSNLANFGADDIYAITPVGHVEERTVLRRSSTAKSLAITAASVTAALVVLYMQRFSTQSARTDRQRVDM